MMSYYPHFHFPPADSWGCSYILAEWKEFTPDTLLRPSDFNFDEWVNDWLPTLGGRPYAAQEPVENRITGVRIVPPPATTRIFTYGSGALK